MAAGSHTDTRILRDDCLRAELSEGVLRLVKMNADTGYGMSFDIWAALDDAFETLVPRDDVLAVIIDAGGPGFHQGAVMVAEMRELQGALSKRDFRDIVQRGQSLGRTIAATPKPTIGLA